MGSNFTKPAGIFGILAVNYLEIEVLEPAGDGADAAGADFSAVNFNDRGDFGAGAGEKNFVGGGQFCRHNFSLDSRYSQLFFSQFDDSVSGDALENILVQGGSMKATGFDQKNVFGAAFGNGTVRIGENGFVGASVFGFGFGQRSIEIDTGGLGKRRNHAGADAQPDGGDGGYSRRDVKIVA